MDDIVREARRAMDAAAAKSFDQLRARQAADHQELFRRVSLRLGPKADVAGKSTDKRLSEVGNTLDPSLAALYFQYGRYLTDRQLPARNAARQPARHLECVCDAAVEFELDGEHQRADELLACRDVQSGRVRRTAFRPHCGTERYGKTGGAGDLRSAGLGIASQRRCVAGGKPCRRGRGSAHVGESGT